MSGSQNWSCTCSDCKISSIPVEFKIIDSHPIREISDHESTCSTVCVTMIVITWAVGLILAIYVVANVKRIFKTFNPNIHSTVVVVIGIQGITVGVCYRGLWGIVCFVVTGLIWFFLVVIHVIKKADDGNDDRNGASVPLLSPGETGEENEPHAQKPRTNKPIDISGKPNCLIWRDENGVLQCDENVLNELRKVEEKLVVVAITGMYKTGKSYLMNCLAGLTDGESSYFEQGDTIVRQTVGIWLWLRDHPERRGVKLILIDTEGISDANPHTRHDDQWIFTLATLISSTLIHNSLGVIDDDMISKWDFISDLHRKIDQEKDRFDIYAPNLVVTLRDFALVLMKDGKELTPNQYLEGFLDMDVNRKEDYNETRNNIRQLFRDRNCFLFDRPADKKHLRNLTPTSPKVISEDFKKDVEQFKCFVFTECDPMQLQNGKFADGSVLSSIIEYCVKTLNEEQCFSVGGMMGSIAEKESQRAICAGKTEYSRLMEELLDKYPNVQHFQDHHRKATKSAVDIFMKKHQGGQTKDDREQLNDYIQDQYKYMLEEVRKRSKIKGIEIARQCCEEIVKKMNNRSYSGCESLEHFQVDIKEAEKMYDTHRSSIGMEHDNAWLDQMEQLREEFKLHVSKDTKGQVPEEYLGVFEQDKAQGIRKRRPILLLDTPILAFDNYAGDPEILHSLKESRQTKITKTEQTQTKRRGEAARLEKEGFLAKAEQLRMEIKQTNMELSQMKSE